MTDDNNLVQARMINEVIYCERLMYLEREHGEFAHNYFTADGAVIHKRADKPGGSLPPKPREKIADDKPYKARAVWLSSDTLGITAKIDVVEGSSNGTVVPIEYKRGEPPNVPEGAYLPERAQVCAQAMLLREHGYIVEYAEIYFAAAKRHVRIELHDELIAAVKTAVVRVREITQIPPPLIDSPKCRGCSLVGICLPDEVNLLRRVGQEHRQLRPARDDRAPLYVQDHGAKVGLASECLVVRKIDGEKTSIGLPLTSHVCLFGGAQISSQALRECMSRDIQVSFFTTGGWYCGRTVSADSKNVELRLAQYRSTVDPEFCLCIARGLVEAKIENCRTMLRRNAEIDNRVLADLATSAKNATACTSLESLLGIEGYAAKIYFENFSKMLKTETAFDFEKRNRRPPRDPVNALLSLAYSLLSKDFSIAITVVGLDPFLGLYHQPRAGRPSLALDLMEEFRPLIADSVVVTAINTGAVSTSDFLKHGDASALTSAGRRNFIQVYERRMQQEITHPVFGYKISYRRVLEVQARLLSRVILGEIETYPQFLTR